MKILVKTLTLQNMVAKAVKGASGNKMIPITSLMAIEMIDGVLTLTTTDATSTLQIREKGFDAENFSVVVPVELFSKLVAKTTAENIGLTLKENSLEFRGNGTYNIELPLDEDGQLIQFPRYSFDTTAAPANVNLPTVKLLLTANKAALAGTMEIPCLTGYYCGEDEVITTDTFKVCGTKVKVFPRPVLIPAELMQLLDVVESEKITVQLADGKILFTTNEAVIYGVELEGIEDYPVEAIHEFLQTEFGSVCKLPKSALLNVLDRLSLFVTPYDKNGLYLTFNNEGVIISSKKSNGTELIRYQESKDFAPFTCCVDIELLKSQIAAQNGEVVELWYGHETVLKMVCGNITQIIALLEDDRVTEG